MSRKGPELHSTGGFWLLVGALLLAASVRFLLWVAVAAAVHEAGHILAIRALGGRIESLRLTGVGAVLRTRRAGLCSYREECLVALAGPLASLLLALLRSPSALRPPSMPRCATICRAARRRCAPAARIASSLRSFRGARPS